MSRKKLDETLVIALAFEVFERESTSSARLFVAVRARLPADPLFCHGTLPGEREVFRFWPGASRLLFAD